jgi:hypothetical protein
MVRPVRGLWARGVECLGSEVLPFVGAVPNRTDHLWSAVYVR